MAANPPTPMGGDGGFGASGDHGVGVAALNDAEGVADGVRGGGAGGGGGLVGAARSVLDGDVAGGEVHDRRWDEEGRDLARSAVHHVGVFALDDVEPADAGADVDADVVAVGLIDDQAGVGHGLCGSSESKMDKASHLARLFFLDEEQRVEVLDLGGEADGMAGEIECLDLGHAAAPGEETFPNFRGGLANAAEETDTGNHDAALDVTLLRLLLSRLGHRYLAAFWFFSM